MDPKYLTDQENADFMVCCSVLAICL